MQPLHFGQIGARIMPWASEVEKKFNGKILLPPKEDSLVVASPTTTALVPTKENTKDKFLEGWGAPAIHQRKPKPPRPPRPPKENWKNGFKASIQESISRYKGDQWDVFFKERGIKPYVLSLVLGFVDFGNFGFRTAHKFYTFYRGDVNGFASECVLFTKESGFAEQFASTQSETIVMPRYQTIRNLRVDGLPKQCSVKYYRDLCKMGKAGKTKISNIVIHFPNIFLLEPAKIWLPHWSGQVDIIDKERKRSGVVIFSFPKECYK